MTDPTGLYGEGRPYLPLDFEVDIDGVAFPALIKVTQTFNQLAAEVTREVVGSGGLVRWVVTGVAAGSVDFKLRPERISRRIPQRIADEIPGILVGGIQELESAPIRPEYFTIRALELARSLSDMVGRDRDVPRLTVRHGRRSANLSRHVAVNAARVLIGDENPYSEHGTVEGRLEALNVHGARVFSIWDPLTGQRISCDFGYRIASQRSARRPSAGLLCPE